MDHSWTSTSSWICILVWALLAMSSDALCPRECRCGHDPKGLKQVVCDSGRMEGNVPIGQMDNDVERIVVTAPAPHLNSLNLGKVFYNLRILKELHITRSAVPAIGEATFVGLVNLGTLNLTSNNISQLLDTNFKGVEMLRYLHLDDNAINSTPSAVFRPLVELRMLTMSRNRLDKLVHRIFFGLKNLEVLDLSGNPLQSVEVDRFEDVPALKELYLSDCSLHHFESSIAAKLPNLKTLDLSYNLLPIFFVENPRHMARLQKLYLHGNRIQTVSEDNFKGLRLKTLSLAFNILQFLPTTAFRNLSVLDLDLSFNSYPFKKFDFLFQIEGEIQELNVGGNHIPESLLADLLDSLPKLRTLGISQLSLRDDNLQFLNLPPTLRKLNLSGNGLTYMDTDVLKAMSQLEILDLSRNSLLGLDSRLLQQFDQMTRLRTLYLGGNPWACDKCYIPAMMTWLNSTKLFLRACQNVRNPHCLRCASPEKLKDRPIQFLDEDMMEECPSGFGPHWARSTALGATQIAAIVACVLVGILTAAVLILLAMYYRRGAEYYTHEEERDDNGVYENPGVDDDVGELLVPSAALKQQVTVTNAANSNVNTANGSKSKYGA